ncbi:MAG: nitronate monooxygenase [Thermodesulfobacteriota bacterium]
MLRTPLTTLLGIDHPLIQAGMATECGARLAAAVSNAGALGSIGSIGGPPDRLTAEIAACREATSRPFAVNVVTWDWAPFARDLLEVALAGGAPVLTLSFGDPLPALERCRAAGVRVLVQVQDVAGARAALAARPDALIVQGAEAGGHAGRRGTLGFAAQVIDMAHDSGGEVPVVVAGGVATGRGLAAALAMGAAGAVIGTRFKATHEFGVPAGARTEPEPLRAQKRAIVASDGDDTVKDEIVDDACGLDWPRGVVGRVLRSRFTEEWSGRRDELRAAVARAAGESGNPFAFLMALDEDPQRALNWAGESAGQVREVAPAAAVVREVVQEAELLLERASGLLAERRPAAARRGAS